MHPRAIQNAPTFFRKAMSSRVTGGSKVRRRAGSRVDDGPNELLEALVARNRHVRRFINNGGP